MNFYDITIPTLDRTLQQLSHLLDKGAAYAAERKVEESVLLGMRLFPDMFPLLRQVQIACDFGKGCAARLAGVDVPKYEDHEKTIAELQARITKVREYMASFKPEQINGAETRTITLTVRGQEMSMPGAVYVQRMAIPNLYFHATTAYNLLRHAGVPIGKGDFLGG
jgi:uncharacterized protein